MSMRMSMTSTQVSRAEKKTVIETSDHFLYRMLIDKPLIEEWTEQDVMHWLSHSKLENLDSLKMMFANNSVDGRRLLALTETELKEPGTFGIFSLGRRKKIMRAINFLKATSCRGANHCASLLLPIPKPAMSSYANLRINRSQVFHRRINQSNLGIGFENGAIEQDQARKTISFRKSINLKQVRLSQDLRNTISANIHLKRIRARSGSIDRSQMVVKSELPPIESDCEDSNEPSEMDNLEGAGLIQSLHQNGFNIFIDFKELKREHPTALVGRGGFGDVFKAKWNGTRVAVKKFGKRRMTGKAL